MTPLSEIVLTAAAKEGIQAGVHVIKNVLRKFKAELTTSPQEIEKAISDHQQEVASWASEISFRDYPHGRKTKEVFVPLDIYLSRLRSRFGGESLEEVQLENVLLREGRSCVLLGQPGAGKTTAVKHICERFRTEPGFLSDFQILIRVQLRDLNLVTATSGPEYIARFLQDLLRLRISYPKELSGDDHADSRRALRDRILLDWLNSARAILLLDGFDEITLKARRELAIEEVRKFVPHMTNSAFVLTGRSGEFSYHLEKVDLFEIKPLNDKQIEVFSKQWLGNEHGLLFVEQLGKSPFRDTAIRPLTLAHLCVIYDKVKSIPKQPKSIYRKIVQLLLEEWDKQRLVVRESAYASFDNFRKAEFLAHLAYALTIKVKSSAFDRDSLVSCYRAIHENFALPLNDATKVVDELETHTGLFLQSGRDRFEFSHKSLQEYLTAEHIVRMATIPRNMIELQTMPTELAVAVAISSEPSEYLAELVFHRFNQIRMSLPFARSFVNRLLLEEPDFEVNEGVGYALLALYSQYLASWAHSGEQLHIFIMDHLGSDFAALGFKIRQRIDLGELLAAYSKAETAHAFDGDPIWKLKRKGKGQQKFRFSHVTSLPEELWVRGALLASPELE
jgi:NACHT domain